MRSQLSLGVAVSGDPNMSNRPLGMLSVSRTIMAFRCIVLTD